MRPIPWILAAVVLTTLGILSTYEGQQTLTAPPGAPSLFGGRRMPVADLDPSQLPGVGPEDAGPGVAPVPTTVAVPDKLSLPVSRHGKPLKPSRGLVLVITDGVNVMKPVRVGPSLPPTDGSPQFSEVMVTELAAWLAAKKAELAAPVPAAEAPDAPEPGEGEPAPEAPKPEAAAAAAGPVELEVCLVLGAITEWDEFLKPMLDACLEAGLEEVRFGVLTHEGAKTVAGYPYEFVAIGDGKRAAHLAANDEREVGGFILLKKGGKSTFFRFGTADDSVNYKRASQHKDAIDARHSEAVDWANAQYADDGTAWGLRMESRSSFAAVIEAANVLKEVGIQRWCFENE